MIIFRTDKHILQNCWHELYWMLDNFQRKQLLHYKYTESHLSLLMSHTPIYFLHPAINKLKVVNEFLELCHSSCQKI
jgi:hypothetical protein